METTRPAAVLAERWEQSLGEWFVLHVRSRQEKLVAECLTAMSICHYLPLADVVRYYAGRRSHVRMPLFSGYVFLRGTLDDAYRIDRTRRVAHIIEVKDQAKLDWELTNIRRALESRTTLEPCPPAPGASRVQVRAGPHCGMQGYRRPGGEQLILQVEVLEQAFSVEVDANLLRPID